MQKNKRYTLQDALVAILGDDSEFEGCDDSSDEDHDDPLYNPNSHDRESDESIEPQDNARRWSKVDKTFVEVRRPHIVKEYNTFMGGVDLLDACFARSKKKYHMRSRRWYIYLFWHTIMLGLVNAWLIYRRDCTTRPPIPQCQISTTTTAQESSCST
ncbi:uncharacterized protein V6R79_003969 [Siganus canaliculatus]